MNSPDNTKLIIFALVVGVPILLLEVYPLIFWFIFLPILVVAVILFIKWLKK